MSMHWRAPTPPATTGIDLRIEALPLPAPWNEFLARPASVAVHRWGQDSCQPEAAQHRRSVRVVSIRHPAARGAGSQFHLSRARDAFAA